MDYNAHAKEIAAKVGITVSIRKASKQTAPGWGKDTPHGIKYNVVIEKDGGRDPLAFPFWDSLHNKQAGKTPTVYSVLACVASEMSMPQTADEVFDEFGEMKPSQCESIAEWSRKLNQFFTPAEAEALSEIQ